MLAVMAAVLATGCSVVGIGGSTAPNEWWLNATTPDGRQLLITSQFGGVASDCTRWEDWHIDASAERVEVEALLWRKHRPSACTDEGVARSLLLDLDDPLGERVLAGCGREDCRAEDFPGWLGDHHGRIVGVDGGLVAADVTRVRGFDDDGRSRWDVDATSSGELYATSGVVVMADVHGTIAWDAVTGERRWSAGGHPFAATDELVLQCAETGGIQAVDAATGQKRWRIDVPCGSAATSGDIIAMLTHDPDRDGGQQLVVANSASGEVSLQRELDDGQDDRVGALEGILAIDDGFVVGGVQADLVVLAFDGTERHRFTQPEGRPIGAAGGTVVLQSHERVSVVDLSDGHVVWDRATTASHAVSFTGGMLLLLDGPAGRLSRLDLGTGRPDWTTTVGTSTGLAAVDDGQDTIFVQTVLAVLALDAGTGELRWWEHTPPDTTDASSTRP